jgi:hypothetical protein
MKQSTKNAYFWAAVYMWACVAVVTGKIICWLFDVLTFAWDTFTL